MGRSIKKGPFVDLHLLDKIQKAKEHKSKDADQDLVAAFDDHAGFRRPDVQRPQRQDFQPGVCDGKHGRPPARRVFPDAHLQETRRAHGQGGGEITWKFMPS